MSEGEILSQVGERRAERRRDIEELRRAVLTIVEL